tara:strand:- start:132 stop:374 length:243 start_codon:yes stop_codon:yes gene_type:complete
MGISIWQIVLVLLIIIILFGAGKIPRVMGDVAKGIKSFKAGMREDEDSDADSGDIKEVPKAEEKVKSESKKSKTKKNKQG